MLIFGNNINFFFFFYEIIRLVNFGLKKIYVLYLGKNKLLVPIFRRCFHFGPQILIFFNLVSMFLTRFQLSSWYHLC